MALFKSQLTEKFDKITVFIKEEPLRSAMFEPVDQSCKRQ